MRFLVAFALCLQGCATVYQGPGPSSAADVPRFVFDESHHFGTREDWFDVGPMQERLTIASLRPTIERVSPEALRTIDAARVWRRAQYGLLGGAIVALALSIAVDNPYNSEFYGIGAALLVGGAFAANAHYDALLRDAAATYNRDLRGAFTPSLGYAWRF